MRRKVRTVAGLGGDSASAYKVCPKASRRIASSIGARTRAGSGQSKGAATWAITSASKDMRFSASGMLWLLPVQCFALTWRLKAGALVF